MITVKLYEIVNAREAIAEFAKEKLPIKASYRLTKILRKLEQEVGDFETARLEAIRKHGKEFPWTVDPEKQAEFDAELEKIDQKNEEEVEALVKKYGKETPGNYRIPLENVLALNEDLGELSMQDVELDIPLLDLEDLGSISYSAEKLALFSFIFQEN